MDSYYATLGMPLSVPQDGSICRNGLHKTYQGDTQCEKGWFWMQKLDCAKTFFGDHNVRQNLLYTVTQPVMIWILIDMVFVILIGKLLLSNHRPASYTDDCKAHFVCINSIIISKYIAGPSTYMLGKVIYKNKKKEKVWMWNIVGYPFWCCRCQN